MPRLESSLQSPHRAGAIAVRLWTLCGILAAGQFAAAAGNAAAPWVLQNQNGATAQLDPNSTAESLKISMGNNPGADPWHAQLILTDVPVTKDARHRIEFRARAVRPRQLGCSVGMNHAPWNSLGLYRQVKVSNEWEVFIIEFSAAADDSNSRLYFDLGGNSADIEIERPSISLVGKDGAPYARYPHREDAAGQTAGQQPSNPPVSPSSPVAPTGAPAAAPAALPPAGIVATPTPIADWAGPQPGWTVVAQEGCTAEVQPLANAVGVRVQNIKSTNREDWRVRLSQPSQAWQAAEHYTLHLKAKAEKPRRCTIELQQTNDPWKNPGFYAAVDLTTEWRQFQWNVKVESNEAAATLHLNLGGDGAAVEIADFELTTGQASANAPAVVNAPTLPEAPTEIQPAPVQSGSVQPGPAQPAPVQAATALIAAPGHLTPTQQPALVEPMPSAAANGAASAPANTSDHEPPLRAGWVFSVSAGSVAELAPVHGVAGAYRVVVLHLEDADDWRVQLRHALGAVQAGQEVTLSFRVRADGPRPMSWGLVSGDSWPKVLGQAEQIEISPAWQTVERRFTVTESHPAAALELNFGQSEVAATVAEVRLEIAGQKRVGQ